jgi:LmbE family N-acetylglucosaminyl deacetylase
LLGAELFSGIVPDGTLADTDAVRHHLLIIYRTFRPTLVLAHAPADYHPDHRAAAQVAEAGTWFAASKAFTTDGLAPLDTPPALWWMDTLGMTGFEPSLYIDVSPFAQLKEQLLACHVSQLSRTAGGAMHPLRDLMVEQQSVRGREAGTLAAEAFRPHLTHKRTRAW